MDTTGANLVSQSKEEEGFTLLGDEEQIAHAEKVIQQIVVRTNKPNGLSTSSETICIYIFCSLYDINTYIKQFSLRRMCTVVSAAHFIRIASKTACTVYYFLLKTESLDNAILAF